MAERPLALSWAPYITHLRFRFQFLLSPIFLMGFLLAGGRFSLPFLLAYTAYHFFLYAGGTALNSAYDRDEGPVGGLEHPPQVPPHLLLFSIFWQLAGLAMALAVNWICAAIYVLMFWMSVAYSHPRTRWKGHPLAALFTIALGQGVLPFLAAWSIPHGEIASAFSLTGLCGVLATTMITTGMYPLTAIYQLEEDARRGDVTLAGWLGPRGSFRFAMVCILAGGLSGTALAMLKFTSFEAAGLVLVTAAILLYLARWARGFDLRDISGNFRRIMQLYGISTLGFLLWLTVRLLIAGIASS